MALLKKSLFSLALIVNLGLCKTRMSPFPWSVLPTPASIPATLDIKPLPTDDAGINCDGSFYCFSIKNDGDPPYLGINMEEAVEDDRWYHNGEHIACDVWHLCAFIQKSKDGTSGAHVKLLYKRLREHGCKMCGSIPLGFFNGDHDIEHGELTVNYADEVDGCMENCGPKNSTAKRQTVTSKGEDETSEDEKETSKHSNRLF